MAITASQLKVSVEADGVKETARDLRGLHTEIESFLKAVANVGKDANGFSQIGRAAGQVDAPVKQATKSLSDVGSASKSMEKSGVSAFSSITKSALGFSAAMVGVSSAQATLKSVFEATVGQAANFERTLNVLQATSGATAAEMAQISAKAKALGNDITLPAVSAKDAATAMLELNKAGLSINDTLNASKGVLQLAAAGQLGVAEAAQITASALNSFGLAGNQATRVADLLAAAANASMADVAELGQGMQQASAIFKQANQPIEALVTSMALMSQAGIQGSDAGTSLKTAVLALIAPTSTAEGLMQKLGISVRDTTGQLLPMRQLVEIFTQKLGGLSQAQQDAALKTIFGTDAYRAAAIVLTKGTDAYDKMAASVTKAGSANELAGAQMKGLSGTLAGLQSQWETIALEVGQKAVPALTELAKFASEATNAIAAGLPGAIEAVGAGMARLTPLFQGLVLAGGDIVEFTQQLVTGFRALPEPIQLAIAGTFALIAALTILNAHPVIGGLTALAIAYGYLRKEAEGAERQLVNTNQIMVAATNEVATRTDYAKTRTAEWRAEIDRQTAAGTKNFEMLRGLRTVHEDTSRAVIAGTYQLLKMDEAGQRNTSTFQQLYGQTVQQAVGLKIIEQEAARLGGTLEFTSEKGTILYGALGKIETSTAGAPAAAAQLDPLKQALEDAFKSAEKTLKMLHEITSPPTGVELQVTAQIDAITGAVKNLEAATLTTGKVRSDFISQSRDLINSSGLEGKALADANRVLDNYGKGLIDGKSAAKQLDDVLKPHVATLEGIRDAYGATRQASDSAATAEITNKRGWADSMEDRKTKVRDFVDTATGKFSELGQAIEIDGKPAGLNLTTTYGEGITDGTHVATAAALDVARSAGQAMTFDASAYGLALATGFARGIDSGIGTAVAAAHRLFSAVKAEADQAIVPGSPSKVYTELGYTIPTGLAAGIDDGAPIPINSIQDITDRFHSLANDLSAPMEDAGGAVMHSIEDITAAFAALDPAVEQTGESALSLAGRLLTTVTAGQQLGVTIANITRPTLDMQREISRLDTEIAKLNLQLSYTEPMSAMEASIKNQIAILQAWKGQIQGVITVQEAARKEWELSRTALDHYTASLAGLDAGRANVATFGAGGSPILQGILDSLTDPAAGAKVAQALDALLNNEEVKKLPGAALLGQQLRDAVAAAMADPGNAEASGVVASLLAGLQGQFDAIKQKAIDEGKLTGENFAREFGAALASQDLARQVGANVASGLEELHKRLEEGAQVNVQTVAKMALDVQGELNKLPEFMRGQLGQEFTSAMNDFIAAPTEDGFRRIVAAAQSVHSALEVIPAEFAKLPAPIRDSINQMVRDVQSGALSVTAAKDRIAAALRILPGDFAKLDAAAQQAWMNLALAALQGADITEKAVDDLTESLRRAQEEMRRTQAVAAESARLAAGPAAAASFDASINPQGGDGRRPQITTLENAFGIRGFTFQQVNDEFGTFNSFGAPLDFLANYGGDFNAMMYDLLRGLGAFSKEEIERRKGKAPSFAGGLDEGPMPYTGYAYLHAGEQVLTPAQAQAYLPQGGDTLVHRKDWITDGAPIYGPPGRGGSPTMVNLNLTVVDNTMAGMSPQQARSIAQQIANPLGQILAGPLEPLMGGR